MKTFQLVALSASLLIPSTSFAWHLHNHPRHHRSTVILRHYHYHRGAITSEALGGSVTGIVPGAIWISPRVIYAYPPPVVYYSPPHLYCPPSPPPLRTAPQNLYDEGYSDGYSDGYERGQRERYEEERKRGYREGYDTESDGRVPYGISYRIF